MKGPPEKPYPQSTVQKARAIIERAIGGPLVPPDEDVAKSILDRGKTTKPPEKPKKDAEASPKC